MTKTKVCKCKTHPKGREPLPLLAFNKNKRCKDGYDYYCRKCRVRLAQGRYASNPTPVLERVKAWQQNNPDRVREASQRYRIHNKKKRKQTTKRWRDKNKPLTCFLANKRRAQKLQATPPWAEHQQIQALYKEAALRTKETGVLHVIDHVIPLQSKVVCGLHCLANLQILTQAANNTKTNKLLHSA